MKAWIVIVLTGLAAAGCSTSVDQSVVGTITSEGRPVPAMPVALVRRTGEGACGNPEPIAITDEKGQFLLSRRPRRGRIAVIVQEDTLCVQDGGSWRAIWNNTYGPAPDRLTFDCKKSTESKWECEVEYKYEEQ
jgi:hypothetical protein